MSTVLDEYMQEMQMRLKKKYKEYVKCRYEQIENDIHKLEALILVTDQCEEVVARYAKCFMCREPNLVDLEEFKINASKIFEAFLEGI